MNHFKLKKRAASPRNTGEKSSSSVFFPLLFLLLLLLITSFSPVYGEENSGGDKKFFSDKEETYTFTVGAKIIKGLCIKSAGKTWIDGNLARKIFEATGAEASFDPGAKLLALGNIPSNPSAIQLPADRGGVFTLVINGVILKTVCIKSDSGVFIPLNVIKVIMESSGKKFTSDDSSNLAAISTASSIITPNPTPAEKPESMITPVVSPESLPPEGKEKIKAISSYLNSLKKILEDSKPNEADKKKFSSLEPGKDTMNPDDLKVVVDKQRKMLEQIKKLSPPDEETGEIHHLAISISAKMIRVMEIVTKLITMPDTRANPEAEKEMAMLLKQLTEEEKLFNEKVKNIRKKYKLGETGSRTPERGRQIAVKK